MERHRITDTCSPAAGAVLSHGRRKAGARLARSGRWSGASVSRRCCVRGADTVRRGAERARRRRNRRQNLATLSTLSTSPVGHQHRKLRHGVRLLRNRDERFTPARSRA